MFSTRRWKCSKNVVLSNGAARAFVLDPDVLVIGRIPDVFCHADGGAAVGVPRTTLNCAAP